MLNLGETRTSVDWARYLEHVATQFPQKKRIDLVADRSGIPFHVLNMQTGMERRKFLSDPGHKYVLHFKPIHDSWLNQVKLFFCVVSRRFLKRVNFAGAALLEQRLEAWLAA